MASHVFFLIFLSSLIHASWNFISKKHSGNITIIWNGVAIGGITLLPFALFFNSHSILSTAIMKGWPWPILSGFINAFYFFWLAKAYQKFDISLVYPLSRGLAVLGTSLFSILIFSEKLSLLGCFGILAIVTGIFLLGPKENTSYLPKKYFLYPVGLSLTIIGFYLVDRHGINFIPPLLFISVQYVATALFMLPYMLFKHKNGLFDCLKDNLPAVLIVGLGSILSYLLLLYAFLQGQVAYIVAIRESSVVIGALLGFIFLKEKWSPNKIFALLMITLGLIVVKIGL